MIEPSIKLPLFNKGDRVKVIGSQKTWAEQKTGTVLERIAYASTDSMQLDPNVRYTYTVLIDDMDRNVPPFGKVKFDENELQLVPDESEKGDPVDHPNHYTQGQYEVIDFIESKPELNHSFCLGNAIKYLVRAGIKDPDKKEEDLKKALWYMKRYANKEGTEPKAILTDDFIKDKGLDGSIRGVVIGMLALEPDCIDSAIKTLEIALTKGID